MTYVSFLTVIINFTSSSFVLFIAIRTPGRVMSKEAKKTPVLSKQEQPLSEMRDLLKSRRTSI